MTADEAIGRRDEESLGSVRQRLATLPRERWILLGILGLVVVVHGWRAVRPFFIGGDLLYHWGLTHTILLGTFPPEGPYIGLPAYYPPGFHLILAGLASITGLDVPSATALLGILWLPVIPLGAYLLTRRLTGRADVALVAAALTAFAGGLDFTNDRLWVNSMFLVGHVAYPIYPRDLVFGILPFAMLAFLRATDGERRWVGWALVAGGLLGLCALIQVQLLLPIPIALAALALARAWRDRDRWMAAIGALVITGAVTLLLVGPWLVWLAGVIAKNGGFSIDSSADLLPVRIGFWDYPIQFGLILPLAVIGAGVALLFLRQPDGPRPNGAPGRWSPRPAGGRPPPHRLVGRPVGPGGPLPAELAARGRAAPAAALADREPARTHPGRHRARGDWSRPSSRPRGRGSGVRHRWRSSSSWSRRCRSRWPRRAFSHRPGRSPSTPTFDSDLTASRTSPPCSPPTRPARPS